MYTHTITPREHIHQKKTEDKTKETDMKCKITFRAICDIVIKYSLKIKQNYILQGNMLSYLYVIIWHEINFFPWSHEYKDHLAAQKLGNIQW